MDALETKEKVEAAIERHAASHANRRIGLLIAILAALLALTEAGGKSAQTEALNANVRATDLWAFFQAKTIRRTIVQTAMETAKLELAQGQPPEAKAVIQKRIDDWSTTIIRYDSDATTMEGRQELSERAKEAEAERDKKLAAYHLYEYGSAASQLAIVLASAAIITGLMLLVYVAAGLGALSGILGLLAWLSPTVLHL